MKITREMLEYWYGSDIVLPKDVIRDIVDIANGDYDVKTLREDIQTTWRSK
jgi:hypothetical protein|tara:strand:+ start:356 stop:508 length:153 start_codon:yes stop_codon:yes gene_type:complete